MSEKKLTETSFWDRYWSQYQLPCQVNTSLAFDRCLSRELEQQLKGHRGSILEVGSAPGKWLAFINREIGLMPSGIEYSPVGNEKTIENFSLLGISEWGQLWEGDFLNLDPVEKFDVVMSLGFIEHFSNAADIVDRHLLWLKAGGLLVLGVPNFKGVYHPIQRILDQTILEKHNLDTMDLCFFENLAQRFGLRVKFLDYLGSFEPSLPVARPGIHGITELLVKAMLRLMLLIRKGHFWDRVNNKFISSYILCVYEKVDIN